MKSRFLLFLLAGILAAQTGTAQISSSSAASSDEKSIWEIWKMQQEKPDDHEAISTACLEFTKKAPKDRLALVALNIAAWHMLKMDRKDAAAKLFKTILGVQQSDHLSLAAINVSKAWMTRLDMEQMKQALQIYYQRYIEYPKTVDALKPFQKEGQPPLTDRWGKPWGYAPAEFQHLKKLGHGMYGQRYTIKCSILDTNSELSVATKIPYASGIQLKPVKMLSGMPGKEMVQFETTDGKQAKTILSIGMENGGIVLAYVGPKLLILADMNHWMIVPRPY
jgi:hypothetical protein